MRSQAAFAALLSLALVFGMGCAQLGITSSLHTTFTETTGDDGQINATIWEMSVRNGLFSKIDEAAMTTAYEIYGDDGQLSQKITQGSDALGMDSTAQVEALTATMQGITALAEAFAPMIAAL